MKNLLILFLSILSVLSIHAQSVDDGNRHLYYERYNAAQNTFEQIINQQPGNTAAIYGLTTAYLLTGDVDKANNVINNAPAAVHQDPWFMVAKGAVLLNQNNKTEAANFFQSALEKTREKDPQIAAAIAKAHVNSPNGDAPYALSVTEKAIKRDKKNAAHYVLMGNTYRMAHNGSEAYKAYKKALELDEKNAAAYHAIADIFLSQKNTELYLENFTKAIEADPSYTPSLKKLYAYYFYNDPARALDYYNRYTANADKSNDQKYELTDLYYINKMYGKAIETANTIIAEEGEQTKPRIYKLIGYSYAADKDTAKALTYMTKYFQNEHDSNMIAMDFTTMGDLYFATAAPDSAVAYYTRAIQVEKDSTKLFESYRKLVDITGELKDFTAQAKWYALYNNGNDKATNVDLFQWAVAHYRAGEYEKANNVFGMYIEKYPEQSYGYYWLARSNAALDAEMEQGLAVPHYKKLVEVLENDKQNPNYKSWMIEAYAFLAAYEANKEKDYAEATAYFKKVLEIDPNNEDAKKYLDILEKAETGG